MSIHKRLALAIAGLALVGAFVIVLLPLKADAGSLTAIDCTNALDGGSEWDRRGFSLTFDRSYSDICQDAANDRRLMALLVGGFGVLVGLAIVFVGAGERHL